MIEVIKNLRNIKKFQINVPNQIYIFSDNNLSKLHINFYSELSKFTKVNLYLLSAGEDLWNRINCLEGELEFNQNQTYRIPNHLQYNLFYSINPLLQIININLP